MRLLILIACFFITQQSFTQKLGYKDLLIGNNLSNITLSYKAIPHKDANSFVIKGTEHVLKICDLPIDSIIVQTDDQKRIKTITIQTDFINTADYRELNFEWSKVMQCMINDFSDPVKNGEASRTNSKVAVWIFRGNVWLTLSTLKMFPEEKDQKRRFEFYWERRQSF